MTDIDALEALAKAATPGPYQWTTYVDHDGPPACDNIMLQAVMKDCWEEVCSFAWDEKGKYHPAMRKQAEANAAYAVAANPAAILALIAEVRALRQDAAKVRKAAIFHDQLMESVHGCTDGGCLIRAPKGMHTNGGCRCNRDSMKTQRVLYAAKQLRDAIGGAK
jgi:hypothetical protein